MVTSVCLSSHRFQHGGRRLPNTDGKICFFLAGRVCFDSFDSNYKLNFTCKADVESEVSYLYPADRHCSYLIDYVLFADLSQPDDVSHFFFILV